MLTIFVISDGTGATAEQVVRAALMQFEEAPVMLVREGDVKTPEAVRDVVRRAADATAEGVLIVHTLVSDHLRRIMLEEARSHNIDAMDLMGPMLDRLSTQLALSPQEKPGLLSQLREERARRIEAVEFALRHDDGLHHEELDAAEIILVGVSRTMKTPTCIYLAYRGWFAANVPIIRDIPLPASLLKLPPQRVFGLITTPERLVELRKTRARYTGLPEHSTYTDYNTVREELRHARHLCAQNRWRLVNVTGKSVEEVSNEIVTLIQRPTQGEGDEEPQPLKRRQSPSP
ncbi:MAG: pyruvate, water dikinase regulatory protein [Anaerolineae bacterium]